MKVFKDKLGREWTIDLTIGCMRRVKASIEVDLIAPEAMVDELGKPDAAAKLTLGQRVSSDLMLFVDVLYACLRTQADEDGITVDQFCELIPPNICLIAKTSFQEEWEDFFRLLGRDDQAAVVRAAIDLVNEEHALAVQTSQKLMAAAIPEMRAAVDKFTTEALAELTGWDLVDELAGVVGIDPERLTLKRLDRMAMARQRADWERFAPLLSMLEGCRQNDVPFDALKWMPEVLLPQEPWKPIDKQEAKAFSGFVSLGKGVRKR